MTNSNCLRHFYKTYYIFTVVTNDSDSKLQWSLFVFAIIQCLTFEVVLGCNCKVTSVTIIHSKCLHHWESCDVVLWWNPLLCGCFTNCKYHLHHSSFSTDTLTGISAMQTFSRLERVGTFHQCSHTTKSNSCIDWLSQPRYHHHPYLPQMQHCFAICTNCICRNPLSILNNLCTLRPREMLGYLLLL